MSKSGNKFKVENYANRPVPENAVVEKNINELEAVGDVVIKMASALKTKTKDAQLVGLVVDELKSEVTRETAETGQLEAE